MKPNSMRKLVAAFGAAALAGAVTGAAAASPFDVQWQVVVNNGDYMPTDVCNPANPPDPPSPTCRHFNSYNQPSVNIGRLVVMRARSKGGGGHGGGGHGSGGEPGGHGNQPIHGIFVRDMATEGPVIRILDRGTLVPAPNNRGTTFVETPSFPRIDLWTDTLATRGNHQPVWKVIDESGEIVEQLGTTGIYTNPFGALITGASKLGSQPEFSFFEVPEEPGLPFDVFPGAPAVADADTIVFKGNYPASDNAGGVVTKTGVYYRVLENDMAGGTQPVVLIANNTDTLIPGTTTPFGSTAPPSAADGWAVFAGFDNEENPTLGGIYLAPLAFYPHDRQPQLVELVGIGGRVPGENSRTRFNRLGEGVSFDGRFVGFWGAWGSDTKPLTLQCRNEGNADRVAYCKEQYPSGFETTVPVHQGVFVHDTATGRTHVVARTPDDFDDFVYWNFSGLVPGIGESDEDGEPARWRSASFVAVSGLVDGSLTDATFHAAFKARTGRVESGTYVDPVDGIYVRQGPGVQPMLVMVETGADGTALDDGAVDDTGTPLPVTEMGVERDGFRGNVLVINASMGTEEAGWAGIYLTELAE